MHEKEMTVLKLRDMIDRDRDGKIEKWEIK
jgi:hypothetical protein